MLQDAIRTPVSVSPKSQSQTKIGGDERRVGMPPIPESLDLYLSKLQLEALQTMEYFGWELAFVRRSDLSNIVPVIKHAKKREFAVLDAGGDIIRDPNIGIRH